MLGFASAMAELSFAEQAKITMDFTIVVLNVSIVIISIFLGAQLLSREVENKTLLTLLTHPVSRSQLLVGKILGIFFIVFCVTIFFSIILFIQSTYYQYGNAIELLVIMYGLLLESLIILSLTIFLSCFLRVSIVVTGSISVYLVGHWMDSLKETSAADSASNIYSFLKYSFPNLEMMNWKSLLAGNIELTNIFFAKVSLYSALWVVLYLFLAIIIFNKKDIS